MKIVESMAMTITEQFRTPRSKKRRTRKKWSKNPMNTRTRPDHNCLVMGDTIYCHPSVAKVLRESEQKIAQRDSLPSGAGMYGSISPGSALAGMFF